MHFYLAGNYMMGNMTVKLPRIRPYVSYSVLCYWTTTKYNCNITKSFLSVYGQYRWQRMTMVLATISKQRTPRYNNKVHITTTTSLILDANRRFQFRINHYQTSNVSICFILSAWQYHLVKKESELDSRMHCILSGQMLTFVSFSP